MGGEVSKAEHSAKGTNARQHRRRLAAALRPALLCSWGDGQPDQRANDALCRSSECPPLVGQPIAYPALGLGLDAHGRGATTGARWHRVGAGNLRYPASQTGEDRRGDRALGPQRARPPE